MSSPRDPATNPESGELETVEPDEVGEVAEVVEVDAAAVGARARLHRPRPHADPIEVARARAALTDVEPRPGVAKPDPVLVARGIRREFGGLCAVDVEHLEVQRHTITALIGPNGAGKTTLFNLLTGFDKPDGGAVELAGEDITGVPAYRVARRGLVRTFQLTKVLSRMSVLDNVLLGAPDQPGERFLVSLFRPLWRDREESHRERAIELLERFGLAAKVDDPAGTLSGGQRKLLEMVRALMVDPSVVMLDEPMAGVNPALVQSLLGHVIELRDQGRTVVFVEHDMDVVMSISDWIVCLAEGQVIAEGPPAAILANREVIDAYLGRRTVQPGQP